MAWIWFFVREGEKTMRAIMAIVDVLCRVHRRGVFYYRWDKNNTKEKKGVGNC